ncbi:MAG TPA: class I SAM-dependent methyltransferase [Gemmatimonadaceae bacterium]|nr:class I SAM-dependent methyltransferase [Gemmatimonadaceae bacterium]
MSDQQLGTTEHDPTLEEQIAYYRARAPEYDQWFLRQGRYDRGPDGNREWWSDVRALHERLNRFRPAGRVLELACGTGWWTEQLMRHADTLTAVDASPEVLALNAERVRSDRVRYVCTDLFAWQPDALYDVVFFSFWLSHVPPDRFERFWQLVAASMAPGGRVFLIDSLRTGYSTATNHTLPAAGEVTALRRLNDDREFHVYKIFYQPDELAARLAELGWTASVHHTTQFFLYGSASRAAAGDHHVAGEPGG